MDINEEGKHDECENVIDLLFVGASSALPYLEKCFEKVVPPSPDYFALPQVIIMIHIAMEQTRKYREKSRKQNKENNNEVNHDATR